MLGARNGHLLNQWLCVPLVTSMRRLRGVLPSYSLFAVSGRFKVSRAGALLTFKKSSRQAVAQLIMSLFLLTAYCFVKLAYAGVGNADVCHRQQLERANVSCQTRTETCFRSDPSPRRALIGYRGNLFVL